MHGAYVSRGSFWMLTKTLSLLLWAQRKRMTIQIRQMKRNGQSKRCYKPNLIWLFKLSCVQTFLNNYLKGRDFYSQKSEKDKISVSLLVSLKSSMISFSIGHEENVWLNAAVFRWKMAVLMAGTCSCCRGGLTFPSVVQSKLIGTCHHQVPRKGHCCICEVAERMVDCNNFKS